MTSGWYRNLSVNLQKTKLWGSLRWNGGDDLVSDSVWDTVRNGVLGDRNLWPSLTREDAPLVRLIRGQLQEGTND